MRVKAKNYESLLESIKNKKLVELTKQEAFDYYIGYGNKCLYIDVLDENTNTRKTLRKACYQNDQDGYINKMKYYIGKKVTIIALRSKMQLRVEDIISENKYIRFKVLNLCVILDTYNIVS